MLLDRSPLRQAMMACWPVGDRPVQTFTSCFQDSNAPDGFVQVRVRRYGPDADLIFVAPALDETPRAALSWHRQITAACQQLGQQGVQRVHAAVADDARLALQVFRQLGFGVVTGDTVLRRPPGPAPAPETGLTAVRESPLHRAAIDNLVQRGWPDAVRLTRETAMRPWDTYPLGGHAPREPVGRVWLGTGGEVLGAWRLFMGRPGAWLRLVAGDAADTSRLIRHALAEAAPLAGADVAIHASARGYEPALHLALREQGFVPVVQRFRLAKAMAVVVREPVWRAVQIHESAAEAAPVPARPLPAPPARPLSSRRIF